MNISAQKCSSSSSSLSSGLVVGHTLGNKLLSFARSRLPVPNKPPKPHAATTHRRTFFAVAPVPFAPLVDAHAFQPPPPYSVHSTDFLRAPHNTPEPSPPRSCDALVGLGLEGVERGDGCRFDGLGRLSGGFRGAGDALREEVRRMLCDQRRRTREQPATRHDVFYAAVEVQTVCERARNSVPKIRVRRKSAASPTPAARWEGVRRGTIASELRRAASLERRASLSGSGPGTGWRV